jgi:transposase-like protein
VIVRQIKIKIAVGTVVRVRLDRKATSIALLVVLGVREDGQKVLLAVKNMGGETSEAWRVVLDDLVKRGLGRETAVEAGRGDCDAASPRGGNGR